MILASFAESVNENVIGFIAVAGAFAVPIIAIIGAVIKSSVKARAREESRREIAAYVAEGSMSADDGAKLMDAGLPKWERPNRA